MNVLFVASLLSACAFALYYLFPQFFWEEPANAIRLEQDSQLPFKVVDLPGKGKGVIATRDIAVMYSYEVRMWSRLTYLSLARGTTIP